MEQKKYMKNNSLHNDKVTVVTVTYNAKDFLEETILSVINQSYENIEYIIIDGGSTDGTVDIIKKYEDKIDYWISEPDDGIYFAMNKAIEKASGQWINFMNAGDTFADADTVAYVMKHKSEDAELIYGDYIRGTPQRIVKAQKKSNWYSTMPFCHQTLFTKVDIMKKEMFDTRYKLAADHNFVIHTMEQGKQFQYIEHTLAIYAEGGFSQNEPLVACVESLYILLHSEATQNDIENSWWFKLLKKNMSADKTYKIKQLEVDLQKKNDKIKQLEVDLHKLISIKFLYHPIQKIQQYKKLMQTYYALKRK